MDRLYIALAGLSGGLVAALLGWLESGEPFNPRKFGGSVIRALVAGVIFAVGYQLVDGTSILDLLYAFLGGAGVDVLGNRIAGKFGNGGFPLPSGKGGDSEVPQNPKEG
jgi:drug/metabolite transporter (DMT)-like permease